MGVNSAVTVLQREQSNKAAAQTHGFATMAAQYG